MFKQCAVTLMVALAFISCSKTERITEKAISKQILYKGNGAEPQTLDPNLGSGTVEHKITIALFEGLVGYDPKDLSPVPGIAEKWNISKDGKVYTFHLRKDAKWSNGDPVTAHDFVYGWNRILHPNIASEFSYMLYYIKNAKAFNKGDLKKFADVGVKATDDFTLRVELENPTPFFLGILQHTAGFPLHKKTIEKFARMDERSTEWTRPGNMVTNGPFKLKEWEINKKLVVEKNPHYWNADIVKLNEIHFLPIDSQQTEERKFRAGELHVTNEIHNDKIPTYQKKNNKALKIEPYLGIYMYEINTTKPPLDNKNVRKAMAMSIDREAIVKYVTKGGQMPYGGYIPPNTGGFSPSYAIPYDVKKAQKLLADAGYPEGKDFPKVELLYNTHENHKSIAEAVQQMWKKNLGIHVELVNQDWKVYLDSHQNMNFQVLRRGWIGDYNDPNTFLEVYTSYNNLNHVGWKNKDFDAALEKANRTNSQEVRMQQFQKAEELLLKDAVIFPIYVYTRVYLKSPYVHGWYPTILDNHPYQYVYLEKQD